LEPEENEAIVSTVPASLVADRIQRLQGRDPGDGFWGAVIKSDVSLNG
jgi:hypothetical protein